MEIGQREKCKKVRGRKRQCRRGERLGREKENNLDGNGDGVMSLGGREGGRERKVEREMW